MSGPIFQLPPPPSPLSHVLVSWSGNLIGIDALDVSFGVMLVHKPNQTTGRYENQYAGCLTLLQPTQITRGYKGPRLDKITHLGLQFQKIVVPCFQGR